MDIFDVFLIIFGVVSLAIIAFVVGVIRKRAIQKLDERNTIQEGELRSWSYCEQVRGCKIPQEVTTVCLLLDNGRFVEMPLLGRIEKPTVVSGERVRVIKPHRCCPQYQLKKAW